MNSKEEYEIRIRKYESELKNNKSEISMISNLRLLTFFVGFGTSLYLYILKNTLMCIIIAVISLIIFTYLVLKHNRIINNKRYLEMLLEINTDSMKRLNGEWKDFKDSGEDFIDGNHRYSGDLDVFGKGSLYQWITNAKTHYGRLKLKNALTAPLKSSGDIYKRQKAVSEISGLLDWRQKFMAEGMIVAQKVEDPDGLFKWALETEEFYMKPWVKILSKVIPAITLLVIVLSFLTNVIPHYWRSILICIQIIILVPGNAKRSASLGTIFKYKKSIKMYERLLSMIESKDFQEQSLKELKEKLTNNSQTALAQLGKLQKISDMISERGNFFYIIVNILFLWDYQCMISLEAWKSNSGKRLKEWIDVIGEFEMLSSLSNIRFDHEKWTFPVIVEGKRVFKGKSLGHPLLATNAVHNDLSITEPSEIILITGSNMSGKSTLLRTAGVNLILAYAGAPVCAEELLCSIMNIYTCMRIGDNLEKSISSFYAEILRIKMIVEAVKEKKEVFFLLDEIFKGTNSFDRHTGAKHLINMLRKERCIGLLSTHDLELGELEKETGGQVRNYHFREYYENNELKFDYKLREGISTTRNAMYLIKLAGIEVED